MDELKNIIPDNEYRKKDKIVIYWLLDYFTPFNNSNADFYNKKKELEKLEKGT